MKFLRSPATISIYFLFTFLWMVLLLNASELQMKLLKNDSTVELQLLHSISKKILSKICNEYLSIHEILTLRKTCTDFQILLRRNETNMVTFCKDFGSKEMDHIQLIWCDLKYFLNLTYVNALETMEMLIVKENQYAVLTRDKKIIPLHNTQALHLYSKMIFDKFLTHKSVINFETPNFYRDSGKVRMLHWNIYGFLLKVLEDGNIQFGGGPNNVTIPEVIQGQLQASGVKMIASTIGAFAVVLEDGNAVAWGDEDKGGKIPEPIKIQFRQQKNVKMIVSTNSAFAALLEDGSVVAWGNESFGGTISETIQTQLQKKVKMIVPDAFSFTALLENGSVIGWGEETEIPKSIQPYELQKKTCFSCCLLPCLKKYFSNHLNVKMIRTTLSAYLALLENGSVLAWGSKNFGGQIAEQMQTRLQKNVKMIFSTDMAFAALLHDGSVLSWGHDSQTIPQYIPHDLQLQLKKNVQTIFSNNYAFVALLKDGRFVAWGVEECGGKITPEIQTQLKNVKVIFSSCRAFAALKDDGSVFTWGKDIDGGVIPDEIKFKLTKNVKMIFPQQCGFRALCYNGEMIGWGF